MNRYAICPFKLWFDVKILPHILQWLRAWWTTKIYVYLNSDLKQSFYHINYNHKVVVLWTEYKCLFNCNFLEKEASQYIHLCGLMPSWTTKICSFIQNLVEKFLSHTLHLYGFLPSWTAEICLFRVCFVAKLLQQILQSTITARYFFKLWDCEKEALHWKHLCSFLPSWTIAICSFMEYLVEKFLSHSLH